MGFPEKLDLEELQKFVGVIRISDFAVSSGVSEFSVCADFLAMEVASCCDKKAETTRHFFKALAIGLARAGVPCFESLNATGADFAQNAFDFSPLQIKGKRMRDDRNAA